MRRININDVAPDMEVARTIYNSEGRILLQTGVKLNESFIARLRELGISSLYIKNELYDDVEVRDVVAEETRVQTIKVVKENFRSLEKQKKLNIRLVQGAIDNLIDELLASPQVLVNLSDIRTFDDYTFGHSVNVCILAIMAGITMSYHDLKLKELGIGALLHDIGKIKVDVNILNKEDELSHEEFAEIKKHSEYGFEILRQYPDVSLLSAHIAFQHHERWDGKGYPRQMTGENIHEYARIVAVADVYDALTADRPYRPGYSVDQTITIINRMSGIYLDPDCVTAVLANIAIYPIGSVVELNTGEIGIVMDNNKEMPTRPILKIMYDRTHQRFIHPHEIDLSKMSTIVIKKALSQHEITLLLK